jgi:hypothetical protein
MGPIKPIGPRSPIAALLLAVANSTLYTLNFTLLLACTSSSDDLAPAAGDKQGNEAPAVVEERPMAFTAHFAEKTNGVAGARGTRTSTPGDGEFSLTDEELQASGFGVYCWYTGTNSVTFPITGTGHISDFMVDDGTGKKGTVLMLNQRVVYENSQWTYSPTKYWPLADNEKLTFRAYAPYVPYNLQLDDHGMPLLPVVLGTEMHDDVLYGTDYHNGTQHDPLWGTGRLVNPETNEYYDEPDPSDPNQSKSKRYGQHYNNITYPMSGNWRTQPHDPADTRNGVIDWYFHHGMAKLVLTCKVIANPGCDKVVIKGITITPLYNQGLLDLSSSAKTDTYPDKPTWTERDGNITVVLKEEELPDYTPGDLATGDEPLEINTKLDPPRVTDPVALLSSGLLIIPRTYTGDGEDKMVITITYSIDEDDTPLKATAELTGAFYGNTLYTLDLKLTPSTRGLEITMVQAAFTAWKATVEGPHTVYNW